MSPSPHPLGRQRRFPFSSWRLLFVAICGTTLVAPACSDNKNKSNDDCPGVTAATCPTKVPSYQHDIAPIVAARCEGCHSVGNDAGLWPLNDQEGVHDWSDVILRQLRSCSQPPPESGIALSLEERRTFEAWLVCDAPDN